MLLLLALITMELQERLQSDRLMHWMLLQVREQAEKVGRGQGRVWTWNFRGWACLLGEEKWWICNFMKSSE